ncbi:hypothetical protein V6N12_048152 [Hibiscus sabdariffa]|uniref:DUF7733 domain-containing protein n=1 Tax=Hibiscus sabdariffa TaxID=183260 RepID=A0ABR2EK68_9ROSI
MLGVPLAMAPDHTGATGENPERKPLHQPQQQSEAGSIMGSWRVIELQQVVFIMVFWISGLVPLIDLVFPSFASTYVISLSRFAFPSHSYVSTVSQDIFHDSNLFRLYVVVGTTIGHFHDQWANLELCLTNIDPKAHKRPTEPRSTSLELSDSGEETNIDPREPGEILLRKLKHSTRRKSKGLEQQEYEFMTKQANFGSEEATVSPSIKAKGPLDQGHQMERIKVYTRRSKSQLKEPGNCNILASNS